MARQRSDALSTCAKISTLIPLTCVVLQGEFEKKYIGESHRTFCPSARWRETTDPLLLRNSHPRCRGPPSHLPHQLRPDLLQRLGHGRSGKVRWSPRRLLHPGSSHWVLALLLDTDCLSCMEIGPVRYHHVRRDVQDHVQERPQLAPRPRARLREHPHRSLRQQGRRQGSCGAASFQRCPQRKDGRDD